MGIELPSMVGTLNVFSIELTAVERHAAVGTGIPQGERTPRTVASDDQRNLKEHDFVQLMGMDAVGGQGPIPEAGEHERVGRLALRKIEFGHGWRLADGL